MPPLDKTCKGSGPIFQLGFPGENEIDIVAEDELSKRALFAEVKRDGKRISLDGLREKSETFMRSTGKFFGWRLEYRALSLDDM